MTHLDDQDLKALSAQPNEPVRVNQADITCYVLSAGAFEYVQPFLIDRNKREEELRQALHIAFNEEERGEVEPWDTEAVKHEGRAALKQQSFRR